MRQLVVLLCVVVASTFAFHSDQLRVTLNHGGGVYGRYLQSKNGRGIKAFTGIPYAEAPVGKYRFQNPYQKQGWTGYFNNQQYDNVVCPQFDIYTNGNNFHGQEDCLYLNVYVPLYNNKNQVDVTDLPVMFYVHGGGFTSGNGIFHGPEYILDHDVILVTGNYRLGALGFLFNDNNDQFTGNYGLKDQVMMLQWIQDNIQSFGGNKNKVTIFGDNAGAASIGFHMMSPMSKGLFHQAILQGGTQYNQWALQDRQRMIQNTNRLIENLGCQNTQNYVNFVHCMQTKNVYDILRHTQKLYGYGTDPMVTFGPVIENNQNNNQNNNIFLSNDLYENKNYWGNNIPVIIGFNRNEGAYKWVQMVNNKKYFNDFQTQFDNYIPNLFHYNHLDDQTKQQLTNMIKDQYFNNNFNFQNCQTGAGECQNKFIDMVTDGWFLSGVDEFLYNRFNNNKNTGNTFVYFFNYRGDGSFTDHMFKQFFTNGIYNDFNMDYNNDFTHTDKFYGQKYNFGISQNDNLLYIFPGYNNRFMNHRVMTNNDNQIQNLFVNLLVDFVVSGNPTTHNQQYKWTLAKNYPVDYFRIGNYNHDQWYTNRNNNDVVQCQMQNGLFDDRAKFWRQFNTHRHQNNNVNYNKFIKVEL